MRLRALFVCAALVLFAISLRGQTVAHGMTIPASVPVPIVYDAADWTTMCARYNASPATFPNVTPTNPIVNATRQGFIRYCGGSYTAANGGTIDTTGDAEAWLNDPVQSGWYTPTATTANCAASYTQGCNGARWMGEGRILTYFFLYADLDATERETIYRDIARAVAFDFSRTWGSGELPFNNYNWGFTRNGILFGILTYNFTYTFPATECDFNNYKRINICSLSGTGVAEVLLTEALDVRMDSISTYMDTWRGGVPPDGTHYGKYLLDYFTVPQMTAEQYGRALIAETGWWLDSAYRVVVGTTPKVTFHQNSGLSDWAFNSHGDQQDTGGRTPADTMETANWMTYAAVYWDNTDVGNLIRKWLTDRNPVRVPWVKVYDAELGAAGTAISTTDVPLDLYAPGAGHAYVCDTYARGVSDKPSCFYIAMARVDGSHQHHDAGSWQAWRNGEWVSKEAATYSTYINNVTGNGQIGGEQAWATNSLTINNLAYNVPGSDGPYISRVDHDDDYWLGSADYLVYAGMSAAASVMKQEWLVIPSLRVMLWHGVVTTASSATPKTQMVHCPTNPPAVSSDAVNCTRGSEVMRTIFLEATGVTNTYAEIDESAGGTYPFGGSRDPQYRIQAEATGVAASHHFSVHQLLSTGDTEMSATLSGPSGGFYTIDITIGASTAQVLLADGTTMTGGSLNLNGGGAQSFQNVIETVAVTTGGVTWGALTDTTAPVTTIVSPTTATTWNAGGTPSTNLAGTCTDDTDCTAVTWVNDRGGSGTATGTSAWSVSSINLSSGANVITVTATDAAGNNTGTAIDTITVTYTPAVTTPTRLRIGVRP